MEKEFEFQINESNSAINYIAKTAYEFERAKFEECLNRFGRLKWIKLTEETLKRQKLPKKVYCSTKNFYNLESIFQHYIPILQHFAVKDDIIVAIWEDELDSFQNEANKIESIFGRPPYLDNIPVINSTLFKPDKP